MYRLDTGHLVDITYRLYHNTNQKSLHTTNPLVSRIFYASVRELKCTKPSVTELLNNTGKRLSQKMFDMANYD
jgi:hypothetical protein